MDHQVTYDEFEEYYNNVGASIDDDRYFEVMITNAWNLKGQRVNKPGWSGEVAGRSVPTSANRTAPFGTSD